MTANISKTVFKALDETGAGVVPARDIWARLAQAGLTRDDPRLSALSERLEPLTEEDNPWRFSARELDAFIAVKSGDTDRAREIFTQLGDDQLAPQALRGRATEMLSIIGK